MLRIVLIFLSLLPLMVNAQQVIDTDVEGKLLAQTKQLNQFIRRFNSEEDKRGRKLIPGDPLYRNASLRRQYIQLLADESSSRVSPALLIEFIDDVTNQTKPQYLDFFAQGWFAEVNAAFLYQGTPVEITLFMVFEPESQGYKWGLRQVWFSEYVALFAADSSDHSRFIPPMSHETDFMVLRKLFESPADIQYYAHNTWQPDYLSLFFIDLKRGVLQYKQVNQVKFHFTQLSGWYFEVSFFNRPGYNAGWLISNLVKVSEADKALLLNLLLHYSS